MIHVETDVWVHVDDHRVYVANPGHSKTPIYGSGIKIIKYYPPRQENYTWKIIFMFLFVDCKNCPEYCGCKMSYVGSFNSAEFINGNGIIECCWSVLFIEIYYLFGFAGGWLWACWWLVWDYTRVVREASREKVKIVQNLNNKNLFVYDQCFEAVHWEYSNLVQINIDAYSHFS